MTSEKFDKVGEEYWKRFVEPNSTFYEVVQDRLARQLRGKRAYVLDVGAGPGVVARLLDEANIPANVAGCEPSGLHTQGVRLQAYFREKLSCIKYDPFNCNLAEIIGTLGKCAERGDLYDAITLIRSAHEIAESCSREKLFSQLESVLEYMTADGALIVGDPVYTSEAASRPEVISAVRQIQEKTIGHSHVPKDYIQPIELERHLKGSGFKCGPVVFLSHPALKSVAEKYSLNQTPIVFYVATFTKQKS